jgi:SAM-dependent methyltransferase
MDELDAVRQRYDRRKSIGGDLYSPFRYANLLLRQERQRKIVAVLKPWLGERQLSDIHMLEVGCGNGVNLQELIFLGADPSKLIANELLEERIHAARANLPAAVKLLPGNAIGLNIAPASLDLVLQSTVFSSILDKSFRKQLAAEMFKWLKPGGAVLWYDFVYDNPRNPDVQGIGRSEIIAIFPSSKTTFRSATLAPPIARRLGVFSPFAYPALNALPFLRTHLVALLEKPHT